MATLKGANVKTPEAPAEAGPTGDTPQISGGSLGGTPLPLAAPGVPYFLQFHPDHWRVLAGLVVPIPRRLHLLKGANAVDVDRAGRPDPSAALADTQARGWVTLPWDVDGPGTSYLRKAEHGGWIDRWTKLFPGSAATRFDEAGFAQWLAKLIEQGKLNPPPVYALEALVNQFQSEAERSERAGQARRAEQMRASLAIAKAALAAAEAAGE